MSEHWIRRVSIYLTSQTITMFGSSIVQYAISWHIMLTTMSGTMMTIATLCGFLPQVLISMFAGVWADRFDRKRIIVLADSMIAVCTAALAIFYAIGYKELWLLFLLSAIRSLGAGIQSPAVGAFLPELVPQDKLMRVNGINASIMSGMMLLSPAVARPLLDWLGIGAVFWVDVITAAIGISMLVALRVPKRVLPERIEGQHMFREMFSGVDYVKKTQWLRQMIGFYLFFALMFGPVVFLTPLMVARSFGPETWRLQVHEMVFAAGSILGGVFVSVLSNRIKNKTLMLIGASALFGLTTFIMGFSPNFWFYLGVMFPMGISMPFINTGSMTVIQTRTEPAFLGRVLGLVSIAGTAAMPLSMVIFGPLADVISVELQLIVTGAVMVAIALFALRFKALIEAGEPIPLQPEEPSPAI